MVFEPLVYWAILKLLGHYFGFWFWTNKEMPKEINDHDEVFTNPKAKPGQIRKAVLVCKGTRPRVKCHWEFQIQEKP